MKYENDLISIFLEEKQYGQGLRESSLKAYNTAFNHLLSSEILDINDFSTFTTSNAKRFLYSLSSRYNWSSHCHNRIKKNMTVFCKWLVTEKIIKENPFENVPLRILPKKLPKGFTPEQIENMRYSIHRLYPDDSFFHMRAKAIFYTYLYTGLRLYELINLKKTDINFLDSMISVNDWKWQKDRKIPLLRSLVPILEQYEKARENEVPDALNFFPTAFGGTLQHREIYGIVKRLKMTLNFNITPHMFRHTFATELAKKNLNLWNISQILWHTNINTTKIYLSFQCADVWRQIDALDMYK